MREDGREGRRREEQMDGGRRDEIKRGRGEGGSIDEIKNSEQKEGDEILRRHYKNHSRLLRYCTCY